MTESKDPNKRAATAAAKAAPPTKEPAAKPASRTASAAKTPAASKVAVAKATAKAPAAKTAPKRATAAAKPAAASKPAAKAPAAKPAAKRSAAAKPAVKTAAASAANAAPATKVDSASAAKAAAAVAAPAEAAAPKPATRRAAAKKPAAKAATRKSAAKPAAKAGSSAKKAPAAKAAPVKKAPAPKAAPKAEAPKEFADLPPVLIAAAEAAPMAKTGGLADVVGALPKYLRELGVDARIIMPFHRVIKERYGHQVEHLFDFEVKLGWRTQYVGIEKLDHEGTVFYFMDNEFYFGGPIYCGGEFEGEQYAFFTRAVLDALPNLDFEPGILHCNDWHTAMMPMLAKTQYPDWLQGGLKTLLTIHNLGYQGKFSHELDQDLLGVDDRFSTPEFLEHYGCDNMLKAGIVFANKVNTVSPTYAHEITTPEGGEGLDGILRARDIGHDLFGILNGVDYDVWDPQTDPFIGHRYSADDLSGKKLVKQELLAELGLEGGDAPLYAMVGRLVPQKGLSLVEGTLDRLLASDARVIVLGTGYPEFESWLHDAEWRHHGRLCSYIGYNNDLAHRIYAGADFFMMPSQFEPCGISQLIAMRYGTLPIVREVGGLADTVQPYNQYTGEGTGFSFRNYDNNEFLDALWRAHGVYEDDRDGMEKLIRNAMAVDFGFARCARSYAELYRQL